MSRSKLAASLFGCALAFPAGLSGCSQAGPCESALERGPRVSLQDAFVGCNHAPTAVIGAPRLVGKRSMVQLDASASSDIEGEPLSFRWTLLERPDASASSIADVAARTTGFVADTSGIYRIQLVVKDGEVDSAPAVATVSSSNRAPNAVAGPNLQIQPGETVQLDGRQSSDPDGDPLTFSWVIGQAPSGSSAQLEDPRAGNTWFIADLQGRYDVTLEVSDGELVHVGAVVVTAGVPTQPPIAVATGPGTNVVVGTSVQLSGEGSSHPEGFPITFDWRLAMRPSGSSASFDDPSTVRPTFIPDQPGVYQAELVVRDGYSSSAPARVNVVAAGEPGPGPGPGDIYLGDEVFDPGQAYFVGTLLEGQQYPVVCDPLQPNRPTAAFPNARDIFNSIMVRPTDGVLLYAVDVQGGGHEVRRLVPDPVRSERDELGRLLWHYPASPESNDPIIPTPGCASIEWFRVHPSTGAVWHSCTQSPFEWYDEVGAVVDTCAGGTTGQLRRIGYDGSTICEGYVRDASGTISPYDTAGTTSFSGGAVRAHPGGGFWELRYIQSSSTFQLWRILADGSTSVELTYGTIPNGLTLSNFVEALDALGNAYVQFRDPADQEKDSLVRFSGAAAGEVIYTESEASVCKMHGGRAVTGP